MEIWDWLHNLYHKRYRYPTDQEIQGKLWVINRYLSFDQDLTEVVAYVSKYFFCLGTRYYHLLYCLVPSSSTPRVKNGKIKKQYEDEIVERYASMYGLSKRETIDYLKILHKNNKAEEVYHYVGLEKKK